MIKVKSKELNRKKYGQTLFRFHLTDIICGYKKSVLYKLDKKERFEIDHDVAQVLKSFLHKSFTFKNIYEALHPLFDFSVIEKNPYDRIITTFFDGLVNNEFIRSSGKIQSAANYVEKKSLQLLKLRNLENITLEVTNQCNLRCPHCSSNSKLNSPTMELSMFKIKEFIRWIVSNRSIKELVLTGGEPFLRADMLDILYYLKKYQLPVTINTNGLLIKREYFEFFDESKINLKISIHGDSTFYEKYGSCKNSIHELMEKIVLFRSILGNRIHIVLLMTKSNINCMSNAVSFCKKNDISFTIKPVSPFGRAIHNWDKVNIKRKEREKIERNHAFHLKRVNLHLDTVNAKHNEISLLPCDLNQLNILYDGTITHCISIRKSPFPNISQLDKMQHIHNLFYSEMYVNYLQKFLVNNRVGCRTCEFKYDCGGGCPARAIIFYGSIDAVDPLCNISQEIQT